MTRHLAEAFPTLLEAFVSTSVTTSPSFPPPEAAILLDFVFIIPLFYQIRNLHNTLFGLVFDLLH